MERWAIATLSLKILVGLYIALFLLSLPGQMLPKSVRQVYNILR